MAMSRGRPIAGDPDLVQRVSAALDRIVAMPRDRQKLAGDIGAMRGRIEREKPATNSFDVKLARGGLIDAEFAAQFLVLAGLGRKPGETLLEILQRAMEERRLSHADGTHLLAAASVQTALLQIQRTADDKAFDPQHVPDALKRLLVAAAGASLADTWSKRGITPVEAADLPLAAGGAAEFSALEETLLILRDRARAALERVLGVAIG
jgi:glutamate-ammonia-ligase adenylyltransferase